MAALAESSLETASHGAGPMVVLEQVTKTFRSGRLEHPALQGIDLTIERGEFVALIGPSGSGKSTILNLLTGIDRPTTGAVTVDGRRIDEMNEEELAEWRGENVGIVFQFFQLLPTLTAVENAMLPLDFAGKGTPAERRTQAAANLELVGLGDRLDHLPAELSGGEQQRVAIARALACDPALLIGDEPTGNLDTATAAEMLALMAEVNRSGMTVLFVTHDLDIAAAAHRIVAIRDGVVEAGAPGPP